MGASNRQSRTIGLPLVAWPRRAIGVRQRRVRLDHIEVCGGCGAPNRPDRAVQSQHNDRRGNPEHGGRGEHHRKPPPQPSRSALTLGAPGTGAGHRLTARSQHRRSCRHRGFHLLTTGKHHASLRAYPELGRRIPLAPPGSPPGPPASRPPDIKNRRQQHPEARHEPDISTCLQARSRGHERNWPWRGALSGSGETCECSPDNAQAPGQYECRFANTRTGGIHSLVKKTCVAVMATASPPDSGRQLITLV